jgi:hypothetical protein
MLQLRDHSEDSLLFSLLFYELSADCMRSATLGESLLYSLTDLNANLIQKKKSRIK